MGKARIEGNHGQGAYTITYIVKDADGHDKDGKTTSAWCVDYTEDIEPGTIVGTIEIAGIGLEYRQGQQAWTYLIKPGFENGPLGAPGPYWSSQDGQQQPPSLQSASGFFFNASLQPGWQKWKPTFRTGKIISINPEKNSASVCIRPGFDPVIMSNLEPDDLPECDIGEPSPMDDFHLEQVQDFCNRYPGHPVCQEFSERASISYGTWWESIVAINTLVNTHVTYQREVVDRWDVVNLPGYGDCEDYALTKIQLLANQGIPASAMGLAIGKLGSGPIRGNQDVDHAWAVVFTDRGVFHLDQSPNTPLGRQPGTNFRILRYNRFEINARRLDDVPFDYMDCDHIAFEVGDDVVIQFDNQTWDDPKIIGFSSAPHPCVLDLYISDRGSTVASPKYIHIVSPELEIKKSFDTGITGTPPPVGTDSLRFGQPSFADGKIAFCAWRYWTESSTWHTISYVWIFDAASMDLIWSTTIQNFQIRGITLKAGDPILILGIADSNSHTYLYSGTTLVNKLFEHSEVWDLETDGSHVYALDNIRLYKFSMGGGLISSNSGRWAANGLYGHTRGPLLYHGGYFYVPSRAVIASNITPPQASTYGYLCKINPESMAIVSRVASAPSSDRHGFFHAALGRGDNLFLLYCRENHLGQLYELTNSLYKVTLTDMTVSSTISLPNADSFIIPTWRNHWRPVAARGDHVYYWDLTSGRLRIYSQENLSLLESLAISGITKPDLLFCAQV